MTKGPGGKKKKTIPNTCYGPPPASNICINMLQTDSEGVCTGLTCGAYQWYDCMEGDWVLATMGVGISLDPNCTFVGLHEECDCPGAGGSSQRSNVLPTAGSPDE